MRRPPDDETLSDVITRYLGTGPGPRGVPMTIGGRLLHM